jgi:ATP-dependent DNA helicase RecG
MEKTQNGFELAEMDMNLRGVGEVFGVRQSGIPDLKMSTMMDGRRIIESKEMAEKFIASGDALESYLPLKNAVEEREKRMFSQ